MTLTHVLPFVLGAIVVIGGLVFVVFTILDACGFWRAEAEAYEREQRHRIVREGIQQWRREAWKRDTQRAAEPQPEEAPIHYVELTQSGNIGRGPPCGATGSYACHALARYVTCEACRAHLPPGRAP